MDENHELVALANIDVWSDIGIETDITASVVSRILALSNMSQLLSSSRI